MATRRQQRYAARAAELSGADLAIERSRAQGPGYFAGGFFGRKRDILEREAIRRQQETAGTVFDMLDQQVENMRSLAKSPEDLQIVANFDARARFARATGSLENVDRQLELGAGWLQSQETQRLAAEAAAQAQANLRDSQGLAADNLKFMRDMELSQDLRKNVVTPYTQQMQAFNKAQQLLSTGDRIGYDFAFTMAIQALDGSVVREGERLSYTGSSGVVAQATDLYNRWKGEQTPELEAQLRRAIAATHNAVVDTYRQAVDTYRSQTEAYGGDWGRVGSVVPPMEDWAAPARIAAPSGPVGDNNPLRDDPLGVAAAAAVTAAGAVPDWAKTGALTAGALSIPAMLTRAVPIAGPAGVAAAAYGMPTDVPVEPEQTDIRGVYVPKWLQEYLRRAPNK